jgi:protein-disulfide isomerase
VLLAYLLACGGSSWLLRARLLAIHETSAEHSASASALPQARIQLSSATAPTLGPLSAKVSIVEISDFECPFCQAAAATMKAVLAAYPGQLRVEFRHFPLDQACNPLLKHQVHENACAAARAAVCAAARGKFWPLAEKLFAGNTDPEDLRAALRELDLDDAEQRTCEQRPETAAVVAADIAAASQAGITGVPVFLINGRPLRGARPLAEFRRIIDEELRAAP